MKPPMKRCRVDSFCSVLRDRFPSPPQARHSSLVTRHLSPGRTLAFSILLFAFATSFAFAQRQKIRSEFDKNDWWVERAAIFFPKYQFTLASTNPALQKSALAVPNAITAANILWSSAGGSAWLTGSNWTGGAVPTAVDVAQFGANPTAATGVGINFANATNAGTQTNGSRIEDVGAIEITSSRAAAMIVGNSSGTAGATGTLRLNGATVNGVSDVVIRNNSSQLFTIQNTQAAGNQTMAVALNDATNNIINIDGAGGVTISSIIGGSGMNLTRAGAGAGILTLSGANTFTGTFTASTGTTNLSVNNALGGATAISVASGATLQTSVTTLTDVINNAAAVTLNGTIDLTGGTETVASLAGTNAAASLKIGFSGASTGSFTVGDTNNTSFAGVISGSRLVAGGTVFTKQGTGLLTLVGTNTYSDVTAITAGGITLTNNAGLGATGANNGTTVSSGAALNLDGTGGALSIGAELLTLNGAGVTASPVGALQNIAGSNSWAGAITLGSASTITSTAGILTLTGGITNGGTLLTFDGAGNIQISTTKITGSGGLTKNGAGTLTLSIANDYTGLTTITNGTLAEGVTDAIGTGAVTVNGSSAIFDLGASHNDSVGTVTLDGGGAINGGGTSTLTSTGSFELKSGTVSAILAGSGIAVNKTTAGTVMLSGANTYSGGTNLSGGTIALGNSDTVTSGVIASGPVGKGTLTLGNGTTLRSDSTTSRIIHNNVSLSGNLTLGDATNNGSLTFTDGSLTTATTFALTADTTLTTPSNVNIGQAITGNFSLTKSGNGNLAFSRANSYNGTVLNAGELALNGSATLGSTSGSLTVNGGDLALQATNQTVGALSGSGGIIQNRGPSGGAFTVGNGGGSGSYAGVLQNGTGSGTLSLIKTGTGIQTLTGTNTFSGGATINQGTLQIGVGSFTSVGGGITVNSSGTLLLSGNGRHIGANLGVSLNGGTFDTGGFSEPNGGAGGLAANAIGALTLTATSTISFGAGSSSILEFAGLGTHTASTILQLTNWDGTPITGGSGDRLLFIGLATDFTTNYSQSEVSFNGISGYSVVQFDALSDPYYEVVGPLAAVPEPSTWIGGMLAIGFLGWSQRRRFALLVRHAT
jgi:autotransporter-associated beta strand protein